MKDFFFLSVRIVKISSNRFTWKSDKFSRFINNLRESVKFLQFPEFFYRNISPPPSVFLTVNSWVPHSVTFPKMPSDVMSENYCTYWFKLETQNVNLIFEIFKIKPNSCSQLENGIQAVFRQIWTKWRITFSISIYVVELWWNISALCDPQEMRSEGMPPPPPPIHIHNLRGQ